MMLRAKRLRTAAVCGVVGSSVLILASGCDTIQWPGAPNASTASIDGSVAGAVNESGTPNDIFAQAESAPVPRGTEITIAGRIDSSSDVDVFALGSANAGDRIFVDVRATSLNTVAALFDAAADLIDANDDRSYYGGLVDPSISVTLRQSTNGLYLAIASSSSDRAAGANKTGDYTIKVRHEETGSVPSPRQQVVYVDFEGGDLVQIALEPAERMRPFTAESITGRLSGQSDAIIDAMLEKMRVDFTGLDVILLDSKHHDEPAATHSTLFVGNYNAQFLGLADNVDNGNTALQQEAIIYSEDISLFEALQPTAQEVGQALANIASHELGHLLGLEHTGQITDLMSIAASARQMLEDDLAFERVALYREVFPIGAQNNPTTLLLNVGASSTGRPRSADAATKPPAAASRRLFTDLDIHIPKCNRCAELLNACSVADH